MAFKSNAWKTLFFIANEPITLEARYTPWMDTSYWQHIQIEHLRGRGMVEVEGAYHSRDKFIKTLTISKACLYKMFYNIDELDDIPFWRLKFIVQPGFEVIVRGYARLSRLPHPALAK